MKIGFPLAACWTLYDVTIDLICRKLFQDHELTTATHLEINNSAVY